MWHKRKVVNAGAKLFFTKEGFGGTKGKIKTDEQKNRKQRITGN
jgi:hypothetical protein